MRRLTMRVAIIVPRQSTLSRRHRCQTPFPHGYRGAMAPPQRGPVNRRLSGRADAALPPDACPVRRVLAVRGHRWAVQVLWTLHDADRPLRFRDLQRSLEPITQKELTNRLREVEASGMGHRTVYAEVPPRVAYR